MQPYFFPYIGYYQLVQSVDEFIFFDDVNFIKKGYIHRNSLLKNCEPFAFTLPVQGVSQNKKIAEHQYVGKFEFFLATLRSIYGKAPNLDAILALVQETLQGATLNVASLNASSIKLVFEYLEIPKKFTFTSDLRVPNGLKSQSRILEICRRKGASHYNNSIGGQHLYERQEFLNSNIQLQFVQSILTPYPQGNCKSFVPHLSMLDVLMWNDRPRIKKLLDNYELA